MSKKIKFILEGIEFNLPEKFLETKAWGGKPIPPKINMNHVATANVVKQYVKKKYPEVTVSSKSSSFSGGNSTDVYLSNELGEKVSKEIHEDVNRFGKQFVYGTFNGMIDMYEMSNKDIKTDKGTTLDPSVKYISVMNRPKFGTVPDVYQMLLDMMNGGYVIGSMDLPDAIERVKDYGISERVINKAVNLMK